MLDTDRIFPLPVSRPEIIDFLANRRSNLAKVMKGPGPTPEQRDQMIEIAARVPDHRKLAPWRFIVFEGDARTDIGQHIGAAFKKQNADMPLDRVLFESSRMQRAPLVIAVVSSPKDCLRGTPKWEQELSSAAVCYNLCLVAQASGFGAQWLTEWYAYDAEVSKAMGLVASERVAGFIYIGTSTEPAKERSRPDVSALVSHWN